MNNKKTIISNISKKVIQYLEQKYDLIRFDGNMKKLHSNTYQLIEKSTLNLLEGEPDIFDNENTVDLFAQEIAQKLAVMAYWQIFQTR